MEYYCRAHVRHGKDDALTTSDVFWPDEYIHLVAYLFMFHYIIIIIIGGQFPPPLSPHLLYTVFVYVVVIQAFFGRRNNR